MHLSLGVKAQLAELSYQPNVSQISAWLRRNMGVPRDAIEYIYVERTDTEGFICRHADDCIMSFSGTESLVDLRQDLRFRPSRYLGGYIHRGFKEIIQAIEGPVVAALRRLYGSQRPRCAYAIGHSLGGPIAMGACEALKVWGPIVPDWITTFGCPNGWSRGALASFETRHPAIVNYGNRFDPVTWLLGITSGRPGGMIKLHGKWGHSMSDYRYNAENRK